MTNNYVHSIELEGQTFTRTSHRKYTHVVVGRADIKRLRNNAAGTNSTIESNARYYAARRRHSSARSIQDRRHQDRPGTRYRERLHHGHRRQRPQADRTERRQDREADRRRCRPNDSPPMVHEPTQCGQGCPQIIRLLDRRDCAACHFPRARHQDILGSQSFLTFFLPPRSESAILVTL